MLLGNFACALINMKRDAVMCLNRQVEQPQKVFQNSLTIFLTTIYNTRYSFISDARLRIGTHHNEN